MIDRIAVIGGSSVYTPELVLSLISHNVHAQEIMLIGRPGKKLPLVAGFCRRLLKKSGFPATVEYTTDVSEGVRNAKYVIYHVRVGGMQARLRDERIPPRQGMIGSEAVGAGGVANALRTLPVVLEHAAQIEAVNPTCTLLNLTNPMGTVVEGLLRYSNLNVVGVCDLPRSYVRKLSDILGVDPRKLWIDYVGLNHTGWIQDVRVNGSSQMSRLLERIETCEEDGFDKELIELFRMIPTHNVSFFFHQDVILKRQKSCSQFRAEVLHEAEQQILKLYEDESLTEVPELARARNAVWYEETLVPLIKALESDSESDSILCVRNGESVRDLPEDCSIEVPAKVGAGGVKPHKTGSFPRFLKGLFMAMKESDRLTVEAVRHRSYEAALQALTIHPLVPSYDAALKYLNRIVREEGFELH